MSILCIVFKGQTFIAMDPEAFAPDFQSRLSTFIQEIRQLEPVININTIYWEM